MLTFDKLLFVVPSHLVSDFDATKIQLNHDLKGNEYYRFQQKHPYHLKITLSELKQEVTFEFSAKILKDNYHKLLNHETIRQGLTTILDLGICKFNIDHLIDNAEVYQCDITADFDCPYNMKDLKRHLRANLTNYSRWLFRDCKNNGLEIFNNATDTRDKKRLILYDKHKELLLSKNKSFLGSLDDEESLLTHFENKFRVECNLYTKKQIMQNLQIQDTKLNSVLHAQTNPLLVLYDAMIDETLPNSPEIYRRTEKLIILRQCDYNLSSVEMKLRECTPPNTSIRRKMKAFKQLWYECEGKNDTMNIRHLIAECINDKDVSK